jgi:hypothetical protein
MKHFATVLLLASALLLAACGTGQINRVSDPSASIQQLTVRADGSWAIDLRIENFSSMPMRFDTVDLAMQVAGQAAGTLHAQPALTIGPEAADVTSLTLAPDAGARIVIADALARGRGLTYSLDGTLVAAPEGRGARTFEFKRDNGLSPVPGLTGVLR